MMNRRNQILSVLLVIQIVIGIVVFWPRSTVSGANEAGPLLTGFKAEDLVGLTITDQDGNRIAMKKGADGWVLPEADDYPVLGENVSSLLEKIGNIQTNRQVTQTESSHKRLKVAGDDFLRLIELDMADNSSHKLYIGSSPRASATHVRIDNQPETYLTGELSSYEANAKAGSWIDTIYYTVPETTTVALTLKNSQGEFEFERDETNQWTMKGLAPGETLKADNFQSLLTQATSLRMVAPLGKKEEDWFKLDQPQAIVTLKTEDGQVHTLRIGAKDEKGGSYVAKWSESLFYVRVAEYTASNFIDKARDEYVELPTTPTSEGGPESTEETPTK
jgi:hypothetical protein